MKNIRVQPFLENIYDEKSQHHKSTFYSDIVLQYELLYGVSGSLFADEIEDGLVTVKRVLMNETLLSKEDEQNA